MRVKETHWVNDVMVKDLPECLDEALFEAFDNSLNLEGVWVQKYLNDEGEKRWAVSTVDHAVGKSLLKPIELWGIQAMFSKWVAEDCTQEGLQVLVDLVGDLIVPRWKDQYTIRVEGEDDWSDDSDEEYFHAYSSDPYVLYGHKRTDFAWENFGKRELF